MSLMGADMSGGPGAWGNAQRRVLGILSLAAVVAIVLAALTTFFVAGAQNNVFWGLALVLVLVLGFVLYLMIAKPRAIASDGVHVGPAGPSMVGEAAPPAPVPTHAAPRTITLRCGDCGTVFDIPDHGERPLYHSCPGCGAEGVLREAPAAAPDPAPAPHAEASPWARPAEPAHEPPSAYAPPPVAPAPAAEAPPTRRLKLRCGGCKEVFVIEDTGERPLRRPCVHCGRMGEIR